MVFTPLPSYTGNSLSAIAMFLSPWKVRYDTPAAGDEMDRQNIMTILDMTEQSYNSHSLLSNLFLNTIDDNGTETLELTEDGAEFLRHDRFNADGNFSHGTISYPDQGKPYSVEKSFALDAKKFWKSIVV